LYFFLYFYEIARYAAMKIVMIWTTVISDKSFFFKRICRFLRRYGDRFEFTGPPERRNENATTNLSYATEENRTVSFYLMHTYKIRHSDNTSLIVRYLGFWNPESHTLKLPMNVKLRSDFNGLPIVFGVLNGTSDGQTDVIESDATANDIAPLLDFATIVTYSVNARWKASGSTNNKTNSHEWSFFNDIPKLSIKL